MRAISRGRRRLDAVTLGGEVPLELLQPPAFLLERLDRRLGVGPSTASMIRGYDPGTGNPIGSFSANTQVDLLLFVVSSFISASKGGTRDRVRRRPSPAPTEARERLEQALFEIRRVIAGQDAMLERVLVCLLAQGHLLIEGVPGLAKTLTIKTTAAVLGGSFSRIQFTPDLVPSDLVGTRIYRPGEGVFDTELGPVFCNFLLADEINRAPAKVQSALLEVMQERQVTIGHTTHARARSVPRDGDAEPDRVRGDLPPARRPRSTGSCSRS